MHLENSSAVVTGGASGLGLATVQALLARGVLVTILDLPTSQGAQVAESLGAAASFAPGDVRDDEAVAAAVALADGRAPLRTLVPVSYTHLRAHETVLDLVCRLLLEKKKQLHI